MSGSFCGAASLMTRPPLELLLLAVPPLDPLVAPLEAPVPPLLPEVPLDEFPPLDPLLVDAPLLVAPLLVPPPPSSLPPVWSPWKPPPVDGLALQAKRATASEPSPINRIVFMGVLKGFLSWGRAAISRHSSTRFANGHARTARLVHWTCLPAHKASTRAAPRYC